MASVETNLVANKELSAVCIGYHRDDRASVLTWQYSRRKHIKRRTKTVRPRNIWLVRAGLRYIGVNALSVLCVRFVSVLMQNMFL